jgi:hypothetical protein
MKVSIIRTDQFGTWLDRDLALSLLKIYERYLLPLHLYFDLLLCAFLMRWAQQDVVRQHLKAISLPLTSTQ